MVNLISSERRSKLLSLLERYGTVSGEILSGHMGISRQALNKQIQHFRSSGYKISGKEKVGYRLISKPELLTPEQVCHGLKTRRIGTRIHHFLLLDSTQNKAKELAEAGEPEGTLVIAEEQTSGRGRQGREWFSDEGGIWCSLILRPQIMPQNAPVLSLVFSLAIADAIDEMLKLRCGVKWPNDVLIRMKKVCGILIEMSAESERIHWIVVGFGINVNNRIRSNLKSQAIGLREAAGRKIERAPLLRKVLKKIETYYDKFLREGFTLLKKDYLRRSVLNGKRISILEFKEKTMGKFMGIGDDGSIILLTDSKKQVTFHAGDVSLQY